MKIEMTIAELRRIVTTVFPGSAIEYDNDNQIVIYTGLSEGENGELKEVELVDE